MKILMENLNWNQATVLDSRYIRYLAEMVYERSLKIGLKISDSFSLSNYEPTGIFRFDQLNDIYRCTLWLGKYYYFRSLGKFRNHKLVEYPGYSISHLSQIANFDFYKNPLVPGQRLDFYDKFLQPLYLCLKEFKKIWVNLFFGVDNPNLYLGYNDSTSAVIEKYHIIQDLTGQDRLDYYTYSHARENEICISGLNTHLDQKFTNVGGTMYANWQYFYSFGYQTTKWVPDPPTPPDPDPGENGEWRLESTVANYQYDSRPPDPSPTTTSDAVNINYVEEYPDQGAGGISLKVTNGKYTEYIADDQGNWEINAEYNYPDPWLDFWDQFPRPTCSFTSDGVITITYNGTSQTKSPDSSSSTTNSLTLSTNVGSCTVNIYFYYYEEDTNNDNNTTNTDTSPSGGHWVPSGYENDYAVNLSGLAFRNYLTVPETTIQCPIPLISGSPYQLYLYSTVYPLDEIKENVFKILETSGKTVPYQNSPTINVQPFGDYYLANTGIINHTFETFTIQCEKYPNIVNQFYDYPLDYMSNNGTYRQVDYVPFTYDQTLWRRIGDTPEVNPSGVPLTSGQILEYIGPATDMNFKGVFFQYWYRPLLIVDYSSKFKYN